MTYLSSKPEERLEYYLHKHVVGMYLEFQHTDPFSNQTQDKPEIFSGFIMSVCNDWFWVTAGHILHHIEKAKNEGWKIKTCRLIDFANDNSTNNEGIPFDFDSSCVHYTDEHPSDYSFVMLRPHYKNLLSAGGKEPIDDQQWSDVNKNYKFFEMVGIPTETSLEKVERKGRHLDIGVEFRPCLAPIRIDMDAIQSDPRFVGILADELSSDTEQGRPLSDLDGMSGAPIYGIFNDNQGNLDYRLLGIQSSWLKSKRQIFGHPTLVLGNALKDAINKAKQTMSNRESISGIGNT